MRVGTKFAQMKTGPYVVIPLTIDFTNWSEKVLDIGIELNENAAIN